MALLANGGRNAVVSQASRDCQAAMEATQAGAFDERNADLCVAGVAQIVIATDRRPATMTGVKAAEAQQQRPEPSGGRNNP